MHLQLAVVCLRLLHIKNEHICEDILADPHNFKGLMEGERLVLSSGLALG